MKKNKKVALSKKPFWVLSRRAIAGWLGVIFILCAWMFVVGILVGRGTAPVEFDIDNLQAKLKDSGKYLDKKQNGQTQDESDLVRDKTELDFYEALPEDREDTRIDKETSAAVISKKVEPPADKKSAPTNGEKASSKNKAPKQTDPKTGFKKKKPAKQPVAAKSEAKPTGKVYTVQVAAVKVAKDADRLVAQLKKKGFPAYRALGKVQGQGIWFRVRVGKYESRATARSMKQQLEKAGMKPIIVEQ
jgi:cell division septation protein DedD